MKASVIVLLILVNLLGFIQCDRTQIRSGSGLLGTSREKKMNYERKSLQKKFEFSNSVPKPERRVLSVSSFNSPGHASRNLPWIGKDPKSKGKGMMSKGKGMMGMSKSPKGKGKGPPLPPIDDYYQDDKYVDDKVDDDKIVDDKVDDDGFIDDKMVDDAPPPSGCELMTFNETFVVPAASLFLAPDTNQTFPGTPELPGTLFIFETTNIFEPDGTTTIKGTTVSGMCTRTSFGTDGGGMCSMTFIDNDNFSITIQGYLMGPFGSPLAIVGGTGGMVGIIGEMDFFPVYPNGTTIDGDIFLDPLRYEVIADLGLLVCA